MENKNLLIIANQFPNQRNPLGGIWIKRQVEKLKFNKIYIISLIPYIPRFMSRFSFIPKRMRYNAYVENYSYNNVEVFIEKVPRIPLFLWGRYGKKFTKKVLKLLKNNAIDFDIIRAHFTWSAGYVAGKVKHLYKKPAFLTVHENQTWFLKEITSMRKKYLFVWNSMDKIIRVNQIDLKAFEEIGIDSEKLVCVTNGYTENIFRPLNLINARKKLNLPQEPKILLTIGNLEDYKGHEYLIKAMKNVIDQNFNVKLYIIGKGSLKNKLLNLIRNLSIEKNVFLAGGDLPFEDIPNWYNAADIFILSSLSEGNPTVMFENLGCGKPIIATKVGGIPEIIVNEELGILVEPKSSIQLSEAIVEAIQKEWNLSYILEYSKKFSWKEIVNQLISIYNEKKL